LLIPLLFCSLLFWYLYNMKIDVYTNIVAVHHGFFLKLNVLKTGKEKKNRVIQILEKFFRGETNFAS